jgi:3-hydroxymyristoyl/3-hydroxydecanoyl-(acyl carrier protein) dehydratase
MSQPDQALTLPLHVAADHPALAGHFPGQPIVPGVVLLDEALLALAQAHQLSLARLDVVVAKFLSPVRPGEALAVTITPSATTAGRWTLELVAGLGGVGEGARAAASATVQLAAPPAPATTAPDAATGA